ncbi:MAG: hypothetical protein FJ033_04960 [Chloroflexi bacterium]|nr:hypothetical protein [Chloroflexota bacterium]
MRRREEMHFPPGEPVEGDDPRQLLHELFRLHDRMARAPFSERYVAFMPLLDRAGRLPEVDWVTLGRLYHREYARRRLPEGLDLDWMEMARSRRPAR